MGGPIPGDSAVPDCRGFWCSQALDVAGAGTGCPVGTLSLGTQGWVAPSPPALGREQVWGQGEVGDGGPGVPVPQCPRC